MERIFHYNITSGEQGCTIQHILKEHGFSSQNIIELKKMKESILCNGVWSYVNQRLCEGDCLTIHIKEEHSSEKILPMEYPLDIIYEDEDLMVLNKPAGMPIHPSLNHYEYSLANALAYYFESRQIPFVFRCINRLDKDTSGLTIVAKHMVSANLLSRMVAAKTLKDEKIPSINREYLAIVKGCPTPMEGTIDAPIARVNDSIIERNVDFEKGERAVTHYRVIEQKNGYSLVSLVLETGRTHQIRVHMKYKGYPLIGDSLYNPDTEVISRQALHSHKLSFLHPVTGENLTFTAPLPEDMKRVLF